MKVDEVARGVYRIPLRGVSVFLVEANDKLVLIDAGLKNSPPQITEAIYSMGRLPQDVVAIVVTHAHRDHTGGLAEMKRRTGAEVWMHASDATLVEGALPHRPFGPGTSTRDRCLATRAERGSRRQARTGRGRPSGGRRRRTALRRSARLSHAGPQRRPPRPAPAARRRRAVRGRRRSNTFRTGLSPLNEDVEGSRRSLARLAALEFDVACFAHGRPLRHGASAAFRELAAGLDTGAQAASDAAPKA